MIMYTKEGNYYYRRLEGGRRTYGMVCEMTDVSKFHEFTAGPLAPAPFPDEIPVLPLAFIKGF